MCQISKGWKGERVNFGGKWFGGKIAGHNSAMPALKRTGSQHGGKPAKRWRSGAIGDRGVGESPALRRWRRTGSSVLRGFTPRPSQLAITGQRKPQVVTFKKARQYIYSLTASSASTSATLMTTLADVPDFANYGALFNQYRIDEVKIRFRLIDTNSTDASNFGTVRLPQLLIRKNMDPNLAAPSVTSTYMSELDNVTNFQFTPDNTQVEFVVRPSVGLLAQYTSAISTQQVMKPPQWFNVADSQVPHYLAAVYADFIYGAMQVAIDYEWSVSFRNQK